jgi:hypothetical protein
MPDWERTGSGRDVLERLARGLGPGQGRAQTTRKLERDGLIKRTREGTAMDHNPRRYVLAVSAVEPLPVVDESLAVVVVEVHGKLSARAKRDLRAALAEGRVELRERVLA